MSRGVVPGIAQRSRRYIPTGGALDLTVFGGSDSVTVGGSTGESGMYFLDGEKHLVCLWHGRTSAPVRVAFRFFGERAKTMEKDGEHTLLVRLRLVVRYRVPSATATRFGKVPLKSGFAAARFQSITKKIWAHGASRS